MNKEFRLNLPTVTYVEGEEEKHLEPMEGRVSLRRSITIATADGVKNGFSKRYSQTPEELTILVEDLRYDYANLSGRMESLIELPPKVATFMTEVRTELEKYRAEQTEMLQRVSSTLDELLAGKAKPSGETVRYIQDTFNKLGERLRQVEARLTPPPQKAQ